MKEINGDMNMKNNNKDLFKGISLLISFLTLPIAKVKGRVNRQPYAGIICFLMLIIKVSLKIKT